MTFEANLLTLLKAASPELGTRVYPDFAPTTMTRPYCTYQAIGGQVINLLANDAPGTRNGELQITVWSDTRAESLAIIRAIEDAMRASSTFKARPTGAERWDFDADIPVYSAAQDFSCWHDA